MSNTEHIEPCPICGQTDHVEHIYFSGCSWDWHWFNCTSDECEDVLENKINNRIKEYDYSKGKERAIEEWNKFARNYK